MIVRKKNRQVWWRRRDLNGATDEHAARDRTIHAAEEFQSLLRKEVARCERRPLYREFSLVIIEPTNRPFRLNELQAFLDRMRGRLRITDEVGYWQDQVTLLLPETGREGARVVANFVLDLARSFELQIETEIQVFPWDDQVFGKSEELDGKDNLDDGERHLATDRISPGEEPEPVAPATSSVATNAFEIVNALPTPVWKRALDVLGSALGLIVLSPLFLIVSVAVRLDSKGSAFYVQRREGKDGRVFKIYKFRTMRTDAELLQQQLWASSEQDGPAFKIESDPRVTRVGRYLRKTCIDELPQLLNVLRGEMSLVGPRPLPVGESLASKVWQRRRLQVLPGMTCIWQVDGGRRVSFDQWMRMDLEYINRRSLLLDLTIIVRTLGLVLAHRGSV